MEWIPVLSVFSINIVLVSALFISAWALSVALKNAGIADVFWGVGFVLAAWVSAFAGDGWIGRKVLMTTLTTVWGIRLSVHILLRNRGKGEDPRYQTFRERGGKRFWIIPSRARSVCPWRASPALVGHRGYGPVARWIHLRGAGGSSAQKLSLGPCQQRTRDEIRALVMDPPSQLFR